jgi:hypothetical protein
VGCDLPDDDEKFETGDGRECRVSLAVQWANHKLYNGALDVCTSTPRHRYPYPYPYPYSLVLMDYERFNY